MNNFSTQIHFTARGLLVHPFYLLRNVSCPACALSLISKMWKHSEELAFALQAAECPLNYPSWEVTSNTPAKRQPLEAHIHVVPNLSLPGENSRPWEEQHFLAVSFHWWGKDITTLNPKPWALMKLQRDSHHSGNTRIPHKVCANMHTMSKAMYGFSNCCTK